MRGVLTQADVREQDKLGKARTHRAQRLLDDAVLLPGAGRLLVLLSRDAEEQQRPHVRRREVVYFAEQAVEVEARHARQRLVRERFGRDEEGHHELVEREPSLAHEPAQRSRTAKAAEPGDRERAHG